METKRCNRCKIEKDAHFFCVRTLPSGIKTLKSPCKECEKNQRINGHKKHTVASLEGEIWKPVIGYDRYLISNFSRIKSISHHNNGDELILKHLINPDGYYAVMFHGNGKIKRISIQRLVAIHFIPNPENKPCVNHINNDPSDNRIENLEWCTHQENMDHAVRQGRMQRGEKRYNSVLTNEQVLDIFNSTEEQRPLAKRYGINQGTVAKIRTGQNWSAVTGKKYIKAYTYSINGRATKHNPSS